MTEQSQSLIRHLTDRKEQGGSCYLSHEEICLLLDIILHPPIQVTSKEDDEETNQKTKEVLSQIRSGNVFPLYPMGKIIKSEPVTIGWTMGEEVPQVFWDAAEAGRDFTSKRLCSQEEIAKIAEEWMKHYQAEWKTIVVKDGKK